MMFTCTVFLMDVFVSCIGIEIRMSLHHHTCTNSYIYLLYISSLHTQAPKKKTAPKKKAATKKKPATKKKAAPKKKTTKKKTTKKK